MNNKQQQIPKIVVGILVYNEENKIFLGKCRKWGDRWVVPGGHIEWGETLFECVKREVKEETNLEITKIELIGVQESIFSKEFHEPRHMVFLDYCCKAVNNDIQLNDEIQEYVWITPKGALKKFELGKATTEFIKKFISRSGFHSDQIDAGA